MGRQRVKKFFENAYVSPFGFFSALKKPNGEVASAKVFSKCDVRNGFWHVELDDESSRLTTFSTPFGRYRWKRMPFGIAPASELFQRKLEQQLEGLAGVKNNHDDILVFL